MKKILLLVLVLVMVAGVGNTWVIKMTDVPRLYVDIGTDITIYLERHPYLKNVRSLDYDGQGFAWQGLFRSIEEITAESKIKKLKEENAKLKRMVENRDRQIKGFMKIGKKTIFDKEFWDRSKKRMQNRYTKAAEESGKRIDKRYVDELKGGWKIRMYGSLPRDIEEKIWKMLSDDTRFRNVSLGWTPTKIGIEIEGSWK